MSQLDKHNSLQDLLRDASEGFSVTPPPAAWQHIEQALLPEKKRRRFVWLLLPLLLGAGIYWLALRDNRQPATTAQHIPEKHTTAHNNQPLPATKSENITATVPEKLVPANQQTLTSVQQATTPSKKQIIRKRDYQPNLRRLAVTTPAVTTSEEAVMEEEPEETEVAEPVTTDKGEPAPQAAPEKKEPFSDDYIDSAKEAKQRLTAVPAPAPVVVAKKPKWRLLANTTVGGGYHSLLYESIPKTSNSFTTNDTKRRVFINHLPHRAGLAGGAGVNLQYQLSKKFAIETGLEYFTTGYIIDAYQVSPVEINLNSSAFAANTVGTRLNSSYASNISNAVNNLGGGGGSGPSISPTYTAKAKLINRYHFVGLPLQAVYQPASRHKLSFVMRAGVSLEWRLNTQRANYILSPEQSRYFTDASLQQKWNMALHLQPGVNMRLPNGRNLQLGLAGRLYTSSSYGKDVPLKEYLFSTGIQLHYDLWQSKK